MCQIVYAACYRNVLQHAYHTFRVPVPGETASADGANVPSVNDAE